MTTGTGWYQLAASIPYHCGRLHVINGREFVTFKYGTSNIHGPEPALKFNVVDREWKIMPDLKICEPATTIDQGQNLIYSMDDSAIKCVNMHTKECQILHRFETDTDNRRVEVMAINPQRNELHIIASYPTEDIDDEETKHLIFNVQSKELVENGGCTNDGAVSRSCALGILLYI